MTRGWLELKREHRTLKQYAEGLAAAVDSHIVLMDRIMQQPPTIERGKSIGAAMGTLEMALHQLQHFGLKLTFENMRTARAARRVD